VHFLQDLCGEISKRMKDLGVKGRKLSLKLKKRKAGAPEPTKVGNPGPVDNISKSMPLGCYTDELNNLSNACILLYKALNVKAEDVRGFGLIVDQLDNGTDSKPIVPTSNTMTKYFDKTSTSTENKEDPKPEKKRKLVSNKPPSKVRKLSANSNRKKILKQPTLFYFSNAS